MHGIPLDVENIVTLVFKHRDIVIDMETEVRLLQQFR